MFQQRLKLLRQILREKNIDAFLVSNFFNIFYLSGFKTLTENEREAWILLTNKNTYIFSDSRYLNNESQITNNNCLITKLIRSDKGLIKHLEEIFQEEEIKTCGVEGDDLKISEFQQLIRFFQQTIKFIPTEKLIIKLREIKDDREIEKIKKACEISDQCLKETFKLIEVGKTEKEIAFRMEFWLKEKGYDLAFYPIVAIDENSATVHYDTRSNGTKKVKNGSIILIDFGAKYQNYLSDITRMVFVGKPSNEVIKTYNTLLNAQQKTIKQLRNGAMTKDIDSYCRQHLITNHYPPITNHQSYSHSTGHGVGLEIHEFPKISSALDEKIQANQVITIEPGLYFEGKWGMRIEDTVLVKNNDGESLTKFPKKLLIL